MQCGARDSFSEGFLSEEEVTAEIKKMFDWMLQDYMVRAAIRYKRRANIKLMVDGGQAVKGPFIETLT